jgi:hypothetical protein
VNNVEKAGKQGIVFLILALLAFSGLGIELLLALFIEPLIYGKPMNAWGTGEAISHWIITCVTWGVITIFLIKAAGRRYGFDVFSFKEKLRVQNWIICLIAFSVCIVISVIDWNGIKAIKEFQYNGWLRFIFQYIYYIVETVLVFLIIIFGQKAGEYFFKINNIPWGGILTGLTWGLVHMLTQGSIMSGIVCCIYALLYGVIYLGARKNTIISFVLICLALIL